LLEVTHLKSGNTDPFTDIENMATTTTNGANGTASLQKKILINAFDMSTVGHRSPGQWKNPEDKSATKRKLDYCINLAKPLDRGGIKTRFLTDTNGGYDTFEASLESFIRRGAQWPMTDPTIVSPKPCRSTLRDATDWNSQSLQWPQ
jgi:hypothetical protein